MATWQAFTGESNGSHSLQNTRHFSRFQAFGPHVAYLWNRLCLLRILETENYTFCETEDANETLNKNISSPSFSWPLFCSKPMADVTHNLEEIHQNDHQCIIAFWCNVNWNGVKSQFTLSFRSTCKSTIHANSCFWDFKVLGKELWLPEFGPYMKFEKQ